MSRKFAVADFDEIRKNMERIKQEKACEGLAAGGILDPVGAGSIAGSPVANGRARPLDAPVCVRCEDFGGCSGACCC